MGIVQDIKSAIATLLTNTTYTESSATGTTTAAYVAAVALDNRGVKNSAIVVKNTDAVNSLYYKVTVKHADYAAGTDDDLVAETSLALGSEAVISLTSAYSKVTVSVKDNSGHATYEIEYLQNR